MKRSWLMLSFAAAALTGCSNMMYGPTSAPVVQQNSTYGPRVPLNQPPVQQQGGAFAQATRSAPPVAQHQPAPYSPPAYPGHNPTMHQASPYAQPVAPPQQASGAGWNAPPPPPANNTPPRVYDAPKLPGNATAAESPAAPDSVVVNPNAAENNRPVPVRPPERTSAPASNQASIPPEVPPVRREAASPAPAQSQEVAANKRPPADARSGGGAVSSLLRKASDSLGKGDMDGAVGYLENAQRIEPNNPKILYDVANIRFHQGRHREAEAMASRAVQTAQSTGDKSMEKKAWSLVSKARNELGDRQGALNAGNKAASL